MSQSQIDRAFTNPRTLRSRSLSNRDNSFVNARDLGTVFRSPASLRASGLIGRSDRRDVIKVTFAPGFTGSGSSGQIVVRGGTLTYSLYSSNNGEPPQFVDRQRLSPGTYPFSTPTTPITLPFSSTQYLVFDRPTGNVRYSYQEQVRP